MADHPDWPQWLIVAAVLGVWAVVISSLWWGPAAFR